MTGDEWADWAGARPRADVLHLDTAAAGRSSSATLAAVARHALVEAQVGGYVAQDRAGGLVSGLRHDLAVLMGTDADGVAFVESATAAFDALVRAWPLPEGARVAVAATEWGPNLEVLEQHGHRVESLPVDASGVLDLATLERRLRIDPPDVVLVDQVAAHRGLVQPAAAAVALCRAEGVAVWLDAAQAIGHVPVAAADAVFATSRKWLTGPRGVGMLAVAEPHRDRLRVRRPAKHPGRPPVQQLESDEAHVAGRVGLAVAVEEYLALGPDRTSARLQEVGRLVREAVETTRGWAVVHPGAPAGSITAVAATAGQDVVRTTQRLLREDAILTTASLPWRAPRELQPPGSDAPTLRVSAHVDLTTDDLERLCRALSRA